MPPRSLDLQKASVCLHQAWSSISDQSIEAPADILAGIEAIMMSDHVTFKYILVTGVLGKLVEPQIHPRALQKSSKLRHAYDARSLCHKVVVAFEKVKGDLWGLSNEPFVNKPARHLQHDKNNPQLRDKLHAAVLHDALDAVHRARPNEVFGALVHILRLGKLRSERLVVARSDSKSTCAGVVHFVQEALKESDGGTRLAAITGGFVRLLNQEFAVKVYPPNYSDHFARTAGDIEIKRSKTTVAAFECKHRPLNIDDVRHGIRKAEAADVAEYCFICAAGIVREQDAEIRRELNDASKRRDVLLFDIHDVISAWTAMLNPVRRQRYGPLVVKILREDMRRAEVANKVAETWNRLEPIPEPAARSGDRPQP